MEKLESKMLSFLSEKLNKNPSSNDIKSQQPRGDSSICYMAGCGRNALPKNGTVSAISAPIVFVDKLIILSWQAIIYQK